MGKKFLVQKILHAGQWAPSGDNDQPWKISDILLDSFSLEIIWDQENVYTRLPHPCLLATGMFLENARIMAESLHHDLQWDWSGNLSEKISVRIYPRPSHEQISPIETVLLDMIEKRTVNRFPYKTTLLQPHIKKCLEDSLQEKQKGIRIQWFDSLGKKWDIAKFMAQIADMRLHLPEAYPVHHRIIDWSEADSPDKIPYRALGANKLSTQIIKWGLANQKRNLMLGNIPFASLPFEIEMDFFPGLLCASHFIISFDSRHYQTPELKDYISAGQDIQRFWLKLASLGLVMQPYYTPIMFSHYVAQNIDVAHREIDRKRINNLSTRFKNLILDESDTKLEHAIFTGRVGYPASIPRHRSVRKLIG